MLNPKFTNASHKYPYRQIANGPIPKCNGRSPSPLCNYNRFERRANLQSASQAIPEPAIPEPIYNINTNGTMIHTYNKHPNGTITPVHNITPVHIITPITTQSVRSRDTIYKTNIKGGYYSKKTRKNKSRRRRRYK